MASSVQGHSCISNEECIKVGPWGGNGGREWSFKAEGGIVEIIIHYGQVIDSLTFRSHNGECSEKIGGKGGTSKKIVFDYPGEFLTAISGAHDIYAGNMVTRCLCFYTNRAIYGPFGCKGGSPFFFPFEGGRVILGFHGRAGNFIDALGFYVKQSVSYSCCQELKPKVLDSEECGFATMSLMNADVPRGAGPWGGNKGNCWDDGVFSGIQQVHVHEGNGLIHAIQFQYETKDGKSVWSKRHGGEGGDKIKKINLDSASEHLVGVTGFYGPVPGKEGFEALHSLTLYTNKGKYGPIGEEIGTAFNSALSDGKVVGFHGRSGVFLDALGVHMEYV